MHPPPYQSEQRLSDWPACSLELNCCGGRTVYPLRLLAERHGDRTFVEILARLRCRRCRRPPAPVFLCAGHREHNHGAPPDWAIELVPACQTSASRLDHDFFAGAAWARRIRPSRGIM